MIDQYRDDRFIQRDDRIKIKRVIMYELYNQIKFILQIYNFMSTKFENTLAELHKLKNQLRIELNQIRPCQNHPIQNQNHVKKSQKKAFINNYQQTSYNCPLLPKENQSKSQRKKKIEVKTIPHLQNTRSLQKKHFNKYYVDSVSTQMNIKRTKSSYLNIKAERNQSINEKSFGNSLVGIGPGNQNIQRSRSSIRVYPAAYIGNMGQVAGVRKSLFS